MALLLVAGHRLLPLAVAGNNAQGTKLEILSPIKHFVILYLSEYAYPVCMVRYAGEKVHLGNAEDSKQSEVP